jgi:hypothetical protein
MKSTTASLAALMVYNSSIRALEFLKDDFITFLKKVSKYIAYFPSTVPQGPLLNHLQALTCLKININAIIPLWTTTHQYMLIQNYSDWKTKQFPG